MTQPPANGDRLPSVRVFKARFHIGTYDDVLNLMERVLSQNGLLTIDTSNTMVATLAARDPRYYQALQSFDVRVPDAMPLVWYMRLLGASLRDTCYGPETLRRVWKRFYGQRKIMVIGADPLTRSMFVDLYGEPAAWITDRLNPNDSPQMDALAQRVATVDPDIVFIGLSNPLSYYFMQAIKPRLKRGIFVHVGGSFDLVCGRKKIPPRVFQKLGLGWFFRLMTEPRRLFGRYLKFNSLFLFHAMSSFIRDRRDGIRAEARTPSAPVQS